MLRVDRIDSARLRPEPATADAAAVFEALIAPYWEPQALAIGGSGRVPGRSSTSPR